MFSRLSRELDCYAYFQCVRLSEWALRSARQVSLRVLWSEMLILRFNFLFSDDQSDLAEGPL